MNLWLSNAVVTRIKLQWSSDWNPKALLKCKLCKGKCWASAAQICFCVHFWFFQMFALFVWMNWKKVTVWINTGPWALQWFEKIWKKTLWTDELDSSADLYSSPCIPGDWRSSKILIHVAQNWHPTIVRDKQIAVCIFRVILPGSTVVNFSETGLPLLHNCSFLFKLGNINDDTKQNQTQIYQWNLKVDNRTGIWKKFLCLQKYEIVSPEPGTMNTFQNSFEQPGHQLRQHTSNMTKFQHLFAMSWVVTKIWHFLLKNQTRHTNHHSSQPISMIEMSKWLYTTHTFHADPQKATKLSKKVQEGQNQNIKTI